MSDFRSFLRSFQVGHRIVKKHNRMVVVITVCTLATGTLLITGEEQYVGNISITAEAKEKANVDKSVNTKDVEGLNSFVVENAVISAMLTQSDQLTGSKQLTLGKQQEGIQSMVAYRQVSFDNVKSVKEEIKRQEEKSRAKKINISDEEVRTLQRIVEAEAGDQDIEGRMLVANVVINRTKAKEFPNDVCSVVHQHHGKVYQFSPCMDGSFRRVKVSQMTKKAVERVLNGEDASRGALYFVQRNIAGKHNLSWFDRDLTRLFKHGCHTFYK